MTLSAEKHARLRVFGLCRFFTCEQAVAWAISAYRDATRDLTPPGGEPWIDLDGEPWAGPAEFKELFEDAFRARVSLHAFRVGAAQYEAPLPLYVARCHAAFPAAWRSLPAERIPPLTWRELDAGKLPDLLRLQMPELPQCGTVVADDAAAGVACAG